MAAQQILGVSNLETIKNMYYIYGDGIYNKVLERLDLFANEYGIESAQYIDRLARRVPEINQRAFELRLMAFAEEVGLHIDEDIADMMENMGITENDSLEDLFDKLTFNGKGHKRPKVRRG